VNVSVIIHDWTVTCPRNHKSKEAVTKGRWKKTSQHTSNEVYGDKKITIIFFTLSLMLSYCYCHCRYVCGITWMKMIIGKLFFLIHVASIQQLLRILYILLCFHCLFMKWLPNRTASFFIKWFCMISILMVFSSLTYVAFCLFCSCNMTWEFPSSEVLHSACRILKD